MDITYNLYQKEEETLLAACDKEVLGEKFEEDEISLDVSESFYAGEQTDEDGLKEHFGESTIANLVGKKCVKAAIDAGFGFEENVMKVNGVPHLQIVRMI